MTNFVRLEDAAIREEKAKAAELITSFIKEKLAGNLSNWLNFDYFSLYDMEKYGCPDRPFDCDDSELMRAVYVLLWADDFPGLSFENLGTGKLYRGDTLNTFHTMFGREIPDRPGYFGGLEKYAPSDSLREKVRIFRKRSARLGNFTVLPNLTVEGETLNTLRGCSCLRDYFDRFLQLIQNALTGKEYLEEFRPLMEKNKAFFKYFAGAEGFRHWAEISFFHDYLENSDPAENYPQVAQIFQMNYHWFQPDDRESYFKAAEIYLDRADKIITNRTSVMLGALSLLL
ncbi:MAG: hypothetical protein IKA32_12040 [Lentisphaeria bacterium]|nr:hypothetical protein [Lentisphaeria bacterium]